MCIVLAIMVACRLLSVHDNVMNSYCIFVGTHTRRHTGTPNCSAHNPNEWNAFPPENHDKTLQLTTTRCHIASSRGFENLHSFRFIPAFPFVIYDTSMQQGKENLKEHTIVAAWWCWVRNGMFHDVSEFRTGGHKKKGCCGGNKMDICMDLP